MATLSKAGLIADLSDARLHDGDPVYIKDESGGLHEVRAVDRDGGYVHVEGGDPERPPAILITIGPIS